MASDRGERPRDEQGRFLPKEEAAKKTRRRAKTSGSQAKARASSQKSKPAKKQASKPATRKGGASKAGAGKTSGAAKAKAKASGAKATGTAKAKSSSAAKSKATKAKPAGAAKSKAAKAKAKPAGEGARQAPPAPSIGPNTQIDRSPPSERLAEHEQSDVDAMGRDKRRQVVGGSYGPSTGKQATVYGAFLAVVVVLVGGFILLARELDQPPAEYATEAPWAEAAEQPPPQPLDFPRNGRTEID